MDDGFELDLTNLKDLKPLDNDQKKWIVQSNRIVESSYKLSIGAKKLLSIAQSKLPFSPGAEIGENEYAKVDISAKEYAKAFCIDVDGAYSSIKKSAEELFLKPIFIKNIIDDKTGLTYDKVVRWTHELDFHDARGMVSLRFAGTILKLLVGMDNEWTWYKMGSVSKLKSVQSIRLLEVCAQWRSNGKTKIFKIEDLKKILFVEGKYGKLYDFKRYVLDKSIKQINKTSEMTVSYKVKKKGILFYMKQKDQLDLFSPFEKIPIMPNIS